MKIFKAEQVRDIDTYTMEHEPIASIDLMERAAGRLAGWYVRHFDISRPVVVMAGPGNNGGDALALARMLAESRYQVECFVLDFAGKLSEDCAINLDRLEKQGIVQPLRIKTTKGLPVLAKNDVIIDGIFGSGLTRIVSGAPGEFIRWINQSEATVVSIDIPSGLFGEDNRENDFQSIVKAAVTLTFQFPFLSFFYAEHAGYVGRWRVLGIGLHPEKISKTLTDYQTITASMVDGALPKRDIFSHKGTFGNALMICGCYGMMGAGLLAAESALRGGAGLVTLHVPRLGYSIVQTAIPEVIVSLDQSDIIFTRHPDLAPYQAIGIGPGIGCKENTGRGLKKLLEEVKVPLLIDADGINLLSEHKEWMDLLPAGSILTPHPKEFDRLAGASATSYERHLKQKDLSRMHKIFIVLKGAYTGISTPEGAYFFNTSGNPGMATGGSGDVLSGLITGLLAQGISNLDAAICGVYLHGLAGDLAIEGSSEEALIAGDLMKYVGAAFRKIREKPILDSAKGRKVL